MQVDRDLNIGLEHAYHLGSSCRNHEACHVLDTDGVSTHVLDPQSEVLPVLRCIRLADRICHSYLCMSAVSLGRIDRSLEVSEVVQCIEYPDDIDTVVDRFFDKIVDYVIRIVSVSEDVLASQQHLKSGVRHSISQLSESFPRILIEESDAGIECSAAPALYCVIADAVEKSKCRFHVAERHSGRYQ